jgi:hypothetical protein
MVTYKKLKKGKKYKLGVIPVGKFVRLDREPDGDIVLIFTGSQYGEPRRENTIYPDEEDDFEEIIPPNTAGGSKKNKRSNKNKTTKTRTKKTHKQKSKRFSNKHKKL